MDISVSRRDRIIASAIEIISESGLEGLSTKTLAMKENMSESLLYKYFGGLDEVLIEVIDRFVQFDERIVSTVMAKDESHVDRLREYFDTYTTYYGNYPEITAIILNYEGLLHDYNVREKIANTIKLKRQTVEKLIEGAIREGELVDYYTPFELATILLGLMQAILLERRVTYHDESLKTELFILLDKTLNGLKKKN